MSRQRIGSIFRFMSCRFFFFKVYILQQYIYQKRKLVFPCCFSIKQFYPSESRRHWTKTKNSNKEKYEHYFFLLVLEYIYIFQRHQSQFILHSGLINADDLMQGINTSVRIVENIFFYKIKPSQ